MNKHTFRSHSETYYYGGYGDIEVEVYGDCEYFIPTVHESGITSVMEHIVLIVYK